MVFLHNIIHSHNNILRHWQYYIEYSSHLVWIWECSIVYYMSEKIFLTFILNVRIWFIILSIHQNIVMTLNNVMSCSTFTCYSSYYRVILSSCWRFTFVPYTWFFSLNPCWWGFLSSVGRASNWRFQGCVFDPRSLQIMDF